MGELLNYCDNVVISFRLKFNGMVFILDTHLALVEIANKNSLIGHITNRILPGNEVEFDFYDGVVPIN